MKRKITVAAVVILFVMLTACQTLSIPPTGNSGASAVPAQASGEIAREEAIALALEDAGFTVQQVTGLRAHRDWDDGIFYYEVEFYREGVEYEYEIHAQTGTILKAEKDR